MIRLPGIEEGSIIAAEACEDLSAGDAGHHTDNQHHHQQQQPGSDVSVPSSDHAYRDATKCKRFTVNHLTATSTSNESYRPNPLSEKDLRNELEEQLQVYLLDHYPELDKQRTDQGACAQVWHVPARKLQVMWSKVVKDQSQKTTQEEAMTEKLEEEEREKSGVDEDTYGAEGAQEHDTVADKELRPEEAYDEEEGHEEEGELVEQAEVVSDTDAETDRYIIKIVSGKSNAANFWSGRLLSTYVYTPQDHSLHSTLKVQIHYYENGNVQLNTLNESSITLNDTTAKSIISAVRKYEASYQELLEETYSTLNEKAFKSLRRVLPVTRQKVDWDKVLNYRLGSDLADAQSK